MIATVSGRDETGARGGELCTRACHVETDTGSRLELRLGDAEEIGGEKRVRLTGVEVGVGAHCSHVGHRCSRRGLFSGCLSVRAGRARVRLRRMHATERSEIEKVLLHAATDVDGIDRTEHLTLWIEQRRIPRSGGKIDSQCRSIERSTRLLQVAAHIWKQIRSTLADTRLRFVGPETAALGERALLCGETPGVAEAE